MAQVIIFFFSFNNLCKRGNVNPILLMGSMFKPSDVLCWTFVFFQSPLVKDGCDRLGCLFPPSINLDSVLGVFSQCFQNPIGQDRFVPEATSELCIPSAG